MKKVHNKIMSHHWEEPRRRRVTTLVYQCKHGGVVQPYPHHFCGAQRSLAEPYAHLPQPQQNVATIGGYAASNVQIIAAILTNANQMGEGNANVAYVLGHLHLALSDNS
jgi:hypothetical protein